MSPPKKKNARQEGDASILLPWGYRNLVSQVPLPMTDNDEEDELQNLTRKVSVILCYILWLILQMIYTWNDLIRPIPIWDKDVRRSR